MRITLLLSILIACCLAADAPSTAPSALPTLYIVGDSTVHNHGNDLVGWGDVIGQYFDPAKIKVDNRAIPGRSSRTFFNEGHWDKIMETLKPGDFVLMQMGHNDGAPPDDEKFRGSIRGVGDETQDVDNKVTGKHETVHTYGWYMRKYVTDAKSKGATPIMCSLIPRNMWKDDKVIRSTDTYVAWARQVADEEHIGFIDLNDLIAVKYEKMGADKVKALFPGDHTHTNADGAKLNAQTVVEGIKNLKDVPLAADLLQSQ